MTIRRTRRPQRDFLQVPNATVRDKRLSLRARGLLVLMLSYPDDWNFTREWLARQTDGEGVAAVRTALKELERYGYLVQRRVRRNGRFDWDQDVYETPQSNQADTETIGQESADGIPANGLPADGSQPSYEDCYEDPYEEHNENDQDEAKSGSTLAALAPDATTKTKFNPRRGAEDRQLFQSFLGERIRSIGLEDIPYGVTWHEGILKAAGVYDALLRLPNQNRMKFPGLYLQKINEDMGIDSWLIQRGFELIS